MARSWHVGGYRLVISGEREVLSVLGAALRPGAAVGLVDRLFPEGLATESMGATLGAIAIALGFVSGDAGSPDVRASKKAL